MILTYKIKHGKDFNKELLLAKKVHCKKCGTVENTGVNAGFNIAYLHQQGISRFCKESDLQKGNTNIPKEALFENPQITLKP